MSNETLHPSALAGMKLFNEKKFFEAHEELETAWREEQGKIRDLYRGILQVAVFYLHVTRGNCAGALKVYARSMKWLEKFPAEYHGVRVDQLRRDATQIAQIVKALGMEHIREFDGALLKPVVWD